MKFILIATTLLHLTWGASIADITCPDSCTCQVKEEKLQITCSSYDFIKKLLPKQESTISSLNIINASLTNVDLKLKYLKNLHHLDLSNNKIASLPTHFPYLPKLKSLNLSNNHLSEVSLSQLPKNLQLIDLSHNPISNFPKDWSRLKELRILHLHDASINCDCDNLAVYEQLVKNIIIPENLVCFAPKEFHGYLLKSVNCSLIKDNLLNAMLGDEPGSGLEYPEPQNDLNASLVDDNEEFITADEIATEHKSEDIEEGSGEEGSGFVVFSEPPKACHFNCSTPRPIGILDEKNASPLPSIQEQGKILFEDLLQPEKVTTPKIQEITYSQKEQPEHYNETSDKDLVSDVETFPTNDTVLGEMERASFENSSNNSVYIVVGLLVAFVAFLLVYYINKKKNQRKLNRNRNKNENGFGEEMKPLGKSALEQKPTKLNATPENAPLLNGQNGKINEEKSRLDDHDFENVELRKDKLDSSLTPQPERVTIKAGELPDSIPKTPLLVHRQLNSDGEIVTTTLNSN